jgi:hypothetical protein
VFGLTKNQLAGGLKFGTLAELLWDGLYPVHGVEISYRQAGKDYPGKALRGSHRSFVQTMDGGAIMAFDNDFLLKRRDIQFPEMPEQGDEIRVVDKDFGTVRVYRVGLLNGDRPWRWADSFEHVLRIHTMQNHTEPVP